LFSLTGFRSSQQEGEGEVNINITQVDTSQFPQVTVYVSVTDADGEPVGINPADLVLEESGQVIKPDQIGGVGEVGPLVTMLVMDVSGSMNTGGKLEGAKAAAQAYLQQMRPGDQAGLLVFNTAIEYVQPVTANTKDLSQAVEDLRAKDDTAMYDALVEAVETLAGVGGRKAIIVLTDGLDNRSTHSPEDVIEKIGPAGLSISTIGLGDPTHGRGAQTALDEDALTSLAEKAGGVYGYAENDEDLRALYQLYGRTLQAEYQITYTSPSTLRDGVNRSLVVSLSRPGQGGSAERGQTVYNPGGLVPEIGGPASWSLFVLLLGALLVLLFIPGLVRLTAGLLSGSGKSKSRIKLGKAKSRIKFKD
jgi:VWFA-related protein